MKPTILLGALLVLLTSLFAPAAVRLVPDQYLTIQQAIDDCNAGDTVVIAPGTYTGVGNYDIDFKGKAITVRSTNPNDPDIVAATIIDCQGTEDDEHRGFYFHSAEDSNSALSGVTVINGYARRGGGIECRDYSDPRIINCVIAHNAAESGGGIDCSSQSYPTIENCIIVSNSAYVGGGIITIGGSGPRIVNCTILDNRAGYGGGIACHSTDSTIVSNCILWGNTPSQILDQFSAGIVVTYSNIQGGHQGTGNMDADPIFVDPAGGDFHLSADSSCIDGGYPNYVPYPDQTDIDGDPRVFNGRIDIGADELFYDGPLIAVWPVIIDFFACEGGSDPATETLSIYNRGLDGLEWQLADDCDWLEVSRQAGSSWGELNDVELSVDISGMLGGYYYCDLTITDSAAANSPRVVPVMLHVLGPVIDVSTAQVEFWAERAGENPEDQSFTVRNSGGGTLSWVIAGTSDCNWLEVAPASGASGGEITEVALSVNISELNGGAHTCLLEVSDPNSTNTPQTVTVALRVSDNLLHVPSQFPTIQGGIDYVLEGGTVILADGIYTGDGNRDIDFRGKAITVRSQNGPESCIIDCGGRADSELHRGFYFHSGEDGNSVLSGFTITNGWAYTACGYASGGGAIMCTSSSPTIANCIFTNNTTIIACIVGNSTGGAIYLEESHSIINDCIIAGNTAFGGAGGIHCQPSSNPIIANCTITDNHGVGIMGSDPVITNSILWGNASGHLWDNFSDQLIVHPGNAVVNFCDIQGGWLGLGNIAEDPSFVSPGYWDAINPPWHGGYICLDGGYHLKSEGWRWDTQRGLWTWDEVTSRCIDAGDPGSPLGDEPLSVPADANNEWGQNLRVNMGAYGGTAEASMPPYGWTIRSDYNNDGIVNFTDFACWSIYHGYILPEPPDDSSPSPTLNSADLALFADRWLDQTTWFTTPSPASSLPPNAASNPNPPDGSVGIRLAPVLSWQGGFDAVSHDIYFGTANPPPFQTNQPGRTFEPGPLSPLTTYYWRIDEVKPYGTTAGPVWTFTTSSAGER